MKRPCLPACTLIVAATACLPAAAQHGAHVHGAVTLDVAIDAGTLSLQLEAPLDSLLGFERPPRNAAERQAADALLLRLKNAQGLFAPDPTAQCTFAGSSAESDALQPGAKAGEHADLDASFEFRCQKAEALRSIDLAGLLGAFKRIQRIEAQIASPAGQFKQTLKRPQTVLRWGR